MLATQLVLPAMAGRGGVVINIGSTAGLGTASHDAPEYAVAKAGVTPADIAAAAMVFLADDSLAGRIMLCRQGGEPPQLLPVEEV